MSVTTCNIAIGADHRGFAHKQLLINTLEMSSYSFVWEDVGAFDEKRSDYPIFAHAVCRLLCADKAQYGILLCGSGIGMSIAANRYPGIYAGIAWNEESARAGRADDNTNVLVLPSDFIADSQLIPMVQTWLSTKFLDHHHLQRLLLIDQLLEDDKRD